jgi:hypothetical protein
MGLAMLMYFSPVAVPESMLRLMCFSLAVERHVRPRFAK